MIKIKKKKIKTKTTMTRVYEVRTHAKRKTKIQNKQILS